MAKKILYLDLDGTLIDFDSGVAKLPAATLAQYAGRLKDVPGIFALMDPMPGAVDALQRLAEVYDTYLLSTAPWNNPSAWQDKIVCVRERFGSIDGKPAYKRLILTHHKELNRGDILVDDRPNNGAAEFEGQWIQIGTAPYFGWPEVLSELLNESN